MRKVLAARRETILLVLMLESLHLALWLQFTSPLLRAMWMMFHLGLFLLWQPVWRVDRRLTWYNGLLFIAFAVLFVLSRDWWLRTGWVVVLIGFFGGSIGTQAGTRRMNMLVLAFLTFQLMFPCATALFNLPIAGVVRDAFAVLVGALPLLLFLFPAGSSRTTERPVDPIYALAAATLVTLLVAGSLLTMYSENINYLSALIRVVIAMGGLMLLISWLLTPRLGFSGLAQLWQRAIINVGTPFEQWLSSLAALFSRSHSAADFLGEAMTDLVAMEWISGVQWQGPDGAGARGELTRHASAFALDPLAVRVHTHVPLGGALQAHCRLLVQLINHFYMAKLQERELTRQTHLSAIYETGARVTHDIKNLLQSLQALASVIASDDSGSGNVSRDLVKRQMPHLTQRLQLALDKLQEPALASESPVFLKDWWHDLQTRLQASHIACHADISGDPQIPGELFDSVAENLLENVRAKQLLEPGLRVDIRVFSDGERVALEVSDSGSAIGAEKAGQLLRGPVPSDNGLGIGLYQAARQAERAGFALSLEANRDGRVCFRLHGKSLSG